MSTELPFATLVGKTLASITVADDKETITFVTADGETYRQYHDQDCCESVEVNEIVGELADLIGTPILQAEETSNSSRDDTPDQNRPDDYSESWTWTFYKLATIKGGVTIRWLGESNGYYSESVSFARVTA
jgi:hypothetical protein